MRTTTCLPKGALIVTHVPRKVHDPVGDCMWVHVPEGTYCTFHFSAEYIVVAKHFLNFCPLKSILAYTWTVGINKELCILVHVFEE